ncbi:MAG: hypothetical protein E7676_01480 [Ruminococcaceae bacterium]|nr:hypothetical protein [Oscillospiraceae bacterium]
MEFLKNLLFGRTKFTAFSNAAASYLLYVCVGIFTLYTPNGVATIHKLPALSGLDAEALTKIVQVYMIAAGVLLVIKGIQSLIGVGILGIPCLIGDIAYTAFYAFLLSSASSGASILLIFFIILSVISFIANITSLGGRR